jgi:hypothetical protein
MEIGKTIEECLRNICRFPIIYKESQALSPLEIVKLTGYVRFRTKIKKKDIIAELKKEKNSIAVWIGFTVDKRWTPAWGILRKKDEYVLFYVSPTGEAEINLSFKDPYEACALLVRMEMEGLAKE